MRWVLALLLLTPVVELTVAIAVGRYIGPMRTVLLLLAATTAGLMLVRRQGAAAWRSLNSSLRAGEPPSRELADAVALVLAGVLLVVPGFVSDLVALLLLLPPTRPLVRAPLERAFRRAAADRVTVVQAFGDGRGRASGRPRFGGDVVEGEIVEDGGPPRRPGPAG